MIKLLNCIVVSCFAFTLLTITACNTKKQGKEQVKTPDATTVADTAPMKPLPQLAQLPVRYQTPGYITTKEKGDDNLGDVAGEYQMKVGATIRSTIGPQPLLDVMKRLANLKGMTVSWASDVDQSIPVDVDISANDNFYDAVGNLLRQADYFHEVNGKNIVVRNKTTKVFKIGIPFMQGGYTTTVGGNFLANKDASSGTEGSVKITSADNKFNVWENIDSNLSNILKTAAAERRDVASPNSTETSSNQKKGEGADLGASAKKNDDKSKIDKTEPSAPLHQSVKYTTKDDASFVIDKSIGLITVTAKPSMLKIVENYLNNLKKNLYQQVNIEAKIIEVFLEDSSKIGLDWSSVLKDFNISSTVSFGNAGQVYPHNNNNPDAYANTFVSRVFIPSLDFNVMLNALNEQGDTHVLANPKLTVLNGQPAIISIGKDVAYVKTVTRDVDSDTNETTYTAEVGNVVQGIALGVMASILDDNKVVLHLTPITTDIENLDASGAIPMTSIGDGAIELGLPQVKVREMSTMVEVNSGEMLIIGGLIDSIESNTGKFAPGLGSIPVVKYLFGVEEKQMRKRELVILLTPKVM
jgi:MSHA type pilus biogenesis protein MshL